MGAVPVDPWAAAFGAIGGMGTAALQKQPQSQADQFSLGGFDNSGWTVNVGSGSASPNINKTTSTASGPSAGGAGLLSMLQNPIVLAALLVGVFLLAKK